VVGIGVHAVDAHAATRPRPELVTVTAPCSNPVVSIPEVVGTFRPGGPDFSVGTRGPITVSCH